MEIGKIMADSVNVLQKLSRNRVALKILLLYVISEYIACYLMIPIPTINMQNIVQVIQRIIPAWIIEFTKYIVLYKNCYPLIYPNSK